jgi:predicted dehydrogenase
MSNVQVALFGCGGWGKNLARNLSELGVLAVIVDPSPQAQQLGVTLGVACVDTPDAVFANADISGVVIATPAETHAELALKAFAAGKHVYVEKPIALTMTDAEAVAVAAKAQDRVLMVGHLLQYHPAFAALRSHVADHGLGELRHIISTRYSLGVVRSEENVMWSFSPHDLSMLLSLTHSPARRVRAFGSSFFQENIADVVTMHIEFSCGLTAEIRASWASPQKEHRLTVIGSAAMAVFDDTQGWDQKVKRTAYTISEGAVRPTIARGEETFLAVDIGEPLKAEMEHFLACMASGIAPLTDAAEAQGVLRLLEAGEASLRRDGEWIYV